MNPTGTLFPTTFTYEVVAVGRDAHRLTDLPDPRVNRLNGLGTIRFRHGSSVGSVALSPDGKYALSGGEDRGRNHGRQAQCSIGNGLGSRISLASRSR